jgi:hypothetical protein
MLRMMMMSDRCDDIDAVEHIVEVRAPPRAAAVAAPPTARLS